MDPLFDHEKLDADCVELGFIAWIAAFFDDVSQSSSQNRRELIEQLDRASLSVLLNTAEGNGKRQGRQRAKFFDDARGSAFECAACLDAAVAKGLVSADRVFPGKQMLARVVAMLSRLIDRFDAWSLPPGFSPPQILLVLIVVLRPRAFFGWYERNSRPLLSPFILLPSCKLPRSPGDDEDD
jgi:four helix bundle protein